MKQPTIIQSIWDDDSTFDRYTIVTNEGEALGLSDNPGHPLGFSQFCGMVEAGGHLGQLIAWGMLPETVQSHIIGRLA